MVRIDWKHVWKISKQIFGMIGRSMVAAWRISKQVVVKITQSAKYSWGRIVAFFMDRAIQPLLAENIRFSYDGQQVLKDLNLSVEKSQIVAVVGRSGSGKSTFLKLISGVLTSSHEGEISILGQHKELAKEDIGYVPQDIAVVPDLTIEENIKFFGSLNGLTKADSIKAGKKLMETLQLDVPLEKYPGEMSGGQKVRLNIILSMLHDPEVLILDEPFVGLDYHNRKLLWHFLEHQRNRRKTVILTTHMLTETENHADRLVLLHKGKIFAKGNVSDIRRKLKTRYVVEIRFHQLTKKSLDLIQEYCTGHDISIMDSFNNYMMFSIMNEGQHNYLIRFFEKIKAEFTEESFREPNLDELFLRVRLV